MALIEKTLLVFDFDHTIVNGNTDTHISSMHTEPLPASIEQLCSRTGWIDYIAAIFQLLHSKRVSIEQMRQRLFGLPLVSGMAELIERITSCPDCEAVIVSDSNTLFIEWLLDRFGIAAAFSRVYSNPAHVDEAGCLRVEGYHKQDWCNISSGSLCKGHVMETHIKERQADGVLYKRVFYIGDGGNDLCPALRLSENDVVFPRENYPLAQLLQEPCYAINSDVVPWSCASMIVSRL